MTREEALDLLRKAEEAAQATALEDCLRLLIELQEGSEGQEFLDAAQKGTALALEAFAKDVISAEHGFCQRFLEEVFEQIRPGIRFREGVVQTLARLGKNREALAITENLASTVPGDWQIQAQLGQLRLALRDRQGAREAMERARALVPAAASVQLQGRLVDMDPDEVLEDHEALTLALAAPQDANAPALAAIRLVEQHRSLEVAACLLQMAWDRGNRSPGVLGLQVISYAVSQQPLHSLAGLKALAQNLEKFEQPLPLIAQAALAWRALDYPACDHALDQAADAVLLGPPADRAAILGWFLPGARILFHARGESHPPYRLGYERLIHRLVSHGEISEPVLRAWREVAHHRLGPSKNTLPERVYLVQLLVEGQARRHASDDPNKPQLVGDVLLPFAVAYEVAVEAPDEDTARERAGEKAREFERMLGGQRMDTEIVATEELSRDILRPPLGLMRRSGRIFHQGESADGSSGAQG